ncbi:MAG TPA: 50S ribosomal protein L31 [Planctomycetes bacterium]|nr:50S ribosomal protein L31 [Planctomycetota bacterium]
MAKNEETKEKKEAKAKDKEQKKPQKTAAAPAQKAAPAKGRPQQQSSAAVFTTAKQAVASRQEGATRKAARKSIHPKYVECKIVCGCGNVVMTRASVPEIQVGVCSNCHPFYTGTQKFIDSAGRVEKFQKRYGWTAETALDKEQPAKKARKTRR